VTAFLVDEMFPSAVAGLLRDTYRHDAVHVTEIGLRAAEDAQVAAVARADGRAMVTENVADFFAERDVVLVFVLKKNLPAAATRLPHSQRSSTAGPTTTRTPTSVLTGHGWTNRPTRGPGRATRGMSG
jgi:hypothetical protein